jgi:TP53 regulating kinase-like protein
MEGIKLKGELLALGAESKIVKIDSFGTPFVLKTRPTKPYLIPEIDQYLRTSRISRESKTLTLARSFGIPTPTVYSIDLKSCTIMMDFIDGKTLKVIADQASHKNLFELCNQFGQLIAILHQRDVVHGDPTTSNVIVDTDSKLWLIDFGLADYNATVEMKGVDLHLIKRALETTHWDKQEPMLKAILDGYVDVIGSESDAIMKRMDEIRERGRYH